MQVRTSLTPLHELGKQWMMQGIGFSVIISLILMRVAWLIWKFLMQVTGLYYKFSRSFRVGMAVIIVAFFILFCIHAHTEVGKWDRAKTVEDRYNP